MWTAASLFKGGFASKIRVYFLTRASAKRVSLSKESEREGKVLCAGAFCDSFRRDLPHDLSWLHNVTNVMKLAFCKNKECAMP